MNTHRPETSPPSLLSDPCKPGCSGETGSGVGFTEGVRLSCSRGFSPFLSARGKTDGKEKTGVYLSGSRKDTWSQ